MALDIYGYGPKRLRERKPAAATSRAFFLLGKKEGNVLFNDALNTFYLRFYGVRHMVKDHSDSDHCRLD